MVRFKGFKTLEDARQYKKEHGGYLCLEERTPKRKQLTERGKDYMLSVTYGGLDKERYPYCLQLNESQM